MFIRIKNRERKTKGAHVTQAQTENGVFKARTDILMRLGASKSERIEGTAMASFSGLIEVTGLECKDGVGGGEAADARPGGSGKRGPDHSI